MRNIRHQREKTLDYNGAVNAPREAGRLAALALLMVLYGGVPASALDARAVLAAYSVTTWGGNNGFLFGDTNAFAQDSTGYLWLGTSNGLVRFDGVRFVRWNMEGVPPDAFVMALHASSDGSLWVGMTNEVVRIRDDEATVYSSDHGFRGGLVAQIVEDRDGTIWVGGTAGVWRFRGDRWEQLGAQQHLSARTCRALFLDRDGTLWVGTADGLFRRNAAEDSFQQVTTSSVEALSADASGSLWASNQAKTLTAVTGHPGLREWPGLRFGAARELLHDRHGNLWVGTQGQGLLLLRAATTAVPSFDQVTQRDGLATSAVRALYEDREGNIWVGMTGGLTRLSEKKVTNIAEGETVSALATTGDGSIWIGTNSGLIRLIDGSEQRYGAADGLPNQTIRALHTDRNGRLWVATSRGPARFAAGRFVPVDLPKGILLQRITAMTSDGHGALWISDVDEGLLRLTRDRLAPVKATGFEPLTSIYADRDNRIWLAQLRGELAVYSDGKFASYRAADGSRVGAVSTLYEDSQGTVWVGKTTGLSRLEHDRVVNVENEHLANGVLAIVEDLDNHLWIATREGILQASFTDLSRMITDASTAQYRVYDVADGLAGVPARALPGGIRGVDGAIWFATTNGAARIVPQRPAQATPGARLHIEGVIADDRQLRPASQTVLPAGTSRIEIQYTALTLESASTSRFLYRLDGYDVDWVHAGTQRAALYTNLPPGPYRFRVTNSGMGSQGEAIWDFSIAPKIYQTRAFAVAVGGLLLLIVSGAWRLRLLHLRRQFQVVLTERVRIAREVHDTLLQGLFGVALQIDGISKQLESSPERTKERLENVREMVGRYIRETRSSIWLLRSESLQGRRLPDVIHEAAKTLTADTPVQLRFEVTGYVRQLAAELEQQLLRIVNEAIVNIVKHARATEVQLDLRYHADALNIRVSDNGCGFATERVAGDDPLGLGLIGIRERAEQIGATLTLSSAPGRGTEIELVVTNLRGHGR